MLKFEWSEFVTTSETYMEEFFENLTPKEFQFTDVVISGGDGLVYQYLQSIYKSKFKDYFIKIPISQLPGGSHNNWACDHHG